MSSTRTQIYLTKDQRRRLDALARRDRRSLAELIRNAVDQYLEHAPADPRDALDATFGAAPDFEAPSRREWADRERRIRDG